MMLVVFQLELVRLVNVAAVNKVPGWPAESLYTPTNRLMDWLPESRYRCTFVALPDAWAWNTNASAVPASSLTLWVSCTRSPTNSVPGGSGVAVGRGVDVAVGTGVDVAVDTAVDVAVGNGVAVAFGNVVEVAVGTGVDVAVASGVEVAVASGVEVAVGTGVEVAVGNGVDVLVDTAVEVAVGTGVAVGSDVGVAVLGCTVDASVGLSRTGKSDRLLIGGAIFKKLPYEWRDRLKRMGYRRCHDVSRR